MSRNRSLRIKDKRTRDLAVKLEQQGWQIERTKSGHLRFQKGEQTVFMSSTPSDNRAFLNVRAELRRAGADV